MKDGFNSYTLTIHNFTDIFKALYGKISCYISSFRTIHTLQIIIKIVNGLWLEVRDYFRKYVILPKINYPDIKVLKYIIIIKMKLLVPPGMLKFKMYL